MSTKLLEIKILTRSIKVFFLNMTAEKIPTKVTDLFILIVFVTKSCKNSKDIT